MVDNYQSYDLVINNFKKQYQSINTDQEHLLLALIIGLLERYFKRVPDALKTFDLIHQRGDDVYNDHMAFRSLDIRSLLKIFLPYGYQIRFVDDHQNPFNFKAKKLSAVWLKHPNTAFPRIFVSDFRLAE